MLVNQTRQTLSPVRAFETYMAELRTRFTAKLAFVAGSLLAVITMLAGVFYFSVERYKYHLERSELAHRVLSSYLAVSNHTYRKLNAMGEIVMHGKIDDVEERFANEQSLRDSLNLVRRNIASEVAYVRNVQEGDELDHLVEIERIAERIIRGSTAIQEAVKDGDLARARHELSVLRSEPVAGKFSELINDALQEERRDAAATEAQAAALGDVVVTVLPITTVLMLALGLLVISLFSRSLGRSIDALERAAAAYASGDLDHRTELLPEQEFSRLGHAFNRMAEALATRREAADRSRESLAAEVRERTREFEEINAQLEASDRIRRQLLADISHELRTPLTVIQGESEMALRGEVKSADEYQDTISRVREQALHTSKLVEDILFVARAEEGKARIEKRSVVMSKLLSEVCDDFRGIAEKKRITIRGPDADPQLMVNGDAGRLRQVFAILIDNAIRYSQTDGTVTVSLSSGDGVVELAVRDQGVGLTDEEARQAFCRFYRGDNADRSAQGTGLGLPMAKAIVEAHNGEITLFGKPGEGAEARVRLPVEKHWRAIA